MKDTIHISLKELLRLAGIDLSHPLQLIEKLLPLIPTGILKDDISHALRNNVSPTRRAQLAVDARKLADDLDAQKFDDAAAVIVAAIEGVNP